MQGIEAREIRILRGNEAIRALHEYINELERERAEGLTEKQTAALIRIAKELITSLERQNQTSEDTVILMSCMNLEKASKNRFRNSRNQSDKSQTVLCNTLMRLPLQLPLK